jgi:hypothetical protein
LNPKEGGCGVKPVAVRASRRNAGCHHGLLTSPRPNCGGVLQRCLRDINAGAQHLMVIDSAYERLGQILLGFPDVDPMG